MKVMKFIEIVLDGIISQTYARMAKMYNADPIGFVALILTAMFLGVYFSDLLATKVAKVPKFRVTDVNPQIDHNGAFTLSMKVRSNTLFWRTPGSFHVAVFAAGPGYSPTMTSVPVGRVVAWRDSEVSFSLPAGTAWIKDVSSGAPGSVKITAISDGKTTREIVPGITTQLCTITRT